MLKTAIASAARDRGNAAPGVSLATVIDAFFASYRGRDPSLHARLACWKDRVGDLPIALLCADRVDDEMAFLAARGAMKFVRGAGHASAGRPLASATLNRYLVALGSLLAFARRTRALPRNHLSAIRSVEKLQEGDGRLIHLTAEQVDSVVACAALARWKKLPALIRMAFTTGLRLGTLQSLRWRDIDLISGRASVARTKNGLPHVAHLTPATIKALTSMPRHRLADGLVFSGADEAQPHQFRKAWESACLAANVGHTPFHALRHSCASHLAPRDTRRFLSSARRDTRAQEPADGVAVRAFVN